MNTPSTMERQSYIFQWNYFVGKQYLLIFDVGSWHILRIVRSRALYIYTAQGTTHNNGVRPSSHLHHQSNLFQGDSYRLFAKKMFLLHSIWFIYTLQDMVILASILDYIFTWDQINFLGIVQCLFL